MRSHPKQEAVAAANERLTPLLGKIDRGACNRALFVTAVLLCVVIGAYIQQDTSSYYRKLSAFGGVRSEEILPPPSADVPWYASPRDVKRAWRE